MSRRLTAVIHPELDIVSQGDSIEEARDNLREALELFFECAPPEEIQERLGAEVFVTQVEVAGG
jgi:predicted RNase H-like HicB family nuclease